MPLQRGFVGVVCRSQQDIVDGKTPDAAIATERHFFEGHPRYAEMASQMGVPHLSVKLNQVRARVRVRVRVRVRIRLTLT